MIGVQRRIWRQGVILAGLLVLAIQNLSFGYEEIPVTDGGTIQGQVQLLSGMAPPPEKVQITKDEDTCGKTDKINEKLLVGTEHGIQNVVVSIEHIGRGKRRRREGALLDQQDCRYEPHVVLVPAGTRLTIRNSDGILHNLHSHSEENPAFNKPQPKFKKTLKETFNKAEIIKITCDAHTWMSGWIVVHEHPYYTVTDKRGKFSLSEIPPGEYTLRIWHETLGEKQYPIKVKHGVREYLRIGMGPTNF
jgi:plastocyanin